jgi:hypothetical protein
MDPVRKPKLWLGPLGLQGMGQGSFFRLQNTEALTLVGLFMEGTTLTCLKTYSDAKKRTLVWVGTLKPYPCGLGFKSARRHAVVATPY